MLRSVTAAIAITITVPNIGHAQSSPSVGQKAILVTGASTGSGRKLTEQLAADGYFIYATARKDADLQALATIKNVQGVRLEMTHPGDIAAAVETVTKGGRGLYALVNNAGIGSASLLMETPPEEFASMMAVNVTGPYLMTRRGERSIALYDTSDTHERSGEFETELPRRPFWILIRHLNRPMFL